MAYGVAGVMVAVECGLGNIRKLKIALTIMPSVVKIIGVREEWRLLKV